MISHYIPKDSKFINETVSIYSTLLSFSFEKGMIKISPFDNQGKLIMHYSVYEKDLTEIGKLLLISVFYVHIPNRYFDLKLFELGFHLGLGLRRRKRMCIWKAWKKPKMKIANLKRCGTTRFIWLRKLISILKFI